MIHMPHDDSTILYLTWLLYEMVRHSVQLRDELLSDPKTIQFLLDTINIPGMNPRFVGATYALTEFFRVKPVPILDFSTAKDIILTIKKDISTETLSRYCLVLAGLCESSTEIAQFVLDNQVLDLVFNLLFGEPDNHYDYFVSRFVVAIAFGTDAIEKSTVDQCRTFIKRGVLDGLADGVKSGDPKIQKVALKRIVELLEKQFLEEEKSKIVYEIVYRFSLVLRLEELVNHEDLEIRMCAAYILKKQ
jgi:hypothetical protein